MNLLSEKMYRREGGLSKKARGHALLAIPFSALGVLAGAMGSSWLEALFLWGIGGYCSAAFLYHSFLWCGRGWSWKPLQKPSGGRIMRLFHEYVWCEERGFHHFARGWLWIMGFLMVFVSPVIWIGGSHLDKDLSPLEVWGMPGAAWMISMVLLAVTFLALDWWDDGWTK